MRGTPSQLPLIAPRAPFETVQEIDSTQLELRRRAAVGVRGPLWLRADRQTAGHGRRGRQWDSPTDNLMVSYLGPLQVGVAEAALLGFAVGVALAEWAGKVVPTGCAVGLKWPNDLMLNGAKAGGLLLEADPQAGWLALGLGINLATAPHGLAYPTASLAGVGADPVPDPDAALAALAPACAHWAGILAQEGFDPIRTAWTQRAHGLGLEARVDLGGEQITGQVSGLDPNGALVLLTPTGQRTIGAGDVFFPQLERC